MVTLTVSPPIPILSRSGFEMFSYVKVASGTILSINRLFGIEILSESNGFVAKSVAVMANSI